MAGFGSSTSRSWLCGASEPALKYPAVLTLATFLLAVSGTNALSSAESAGAVRVPAEWEHQEAMWLQWPDGFEKELEPVFGRLAEIIPRYQKLNIIYNAEATRNAAVAAIRLAGGDPEHSRIVWHQLPNDSAWMRDNGPVYVERDGRLRIQNWEFNAWGGAFGDDIPYSRDNRIPDHVGDFLNIPVDRVDIVHERGNLEFNGIDTVVLNWSTLGDPERNPGYTKEQAEHDLKRHFGVERVVFIEGIPEGDLTRGHIDGIARFIDPYTMVIPECTEHSRCEPESSADAQVYDNAASTVEKAGIKVIRDPIEGVARYGGRQFDTNYMNWVVGNGFVIAGSFDNEKTDEAARLRIQGYFPGRDIHLVSIMSSWNAGGGIHCHTNDQPSGQSAPDS